MEVFARSTGADRSALLTLQPGEVRLNRSSLETKSRRGWMERGDTRTVGIGLLAVGAIAASVLLGRLLPEQTETNGPPMSPGDHVPAVELDQIRAAGL